VSLAEPKGMTVKGGSRSEIDGEFRLRAREVLTVGAQLVIQETNSHGRTRRAAGRQDGEKASLSDTISKTTPGNFIGKEAVNPNDEAKRVTRGNEPQNPPELPVTQTP
jgi:hypothetical protein